MRLIPNNQLSTGYSFKQQIIGILHYQDDDDDDDDHDDDDDTDDDDGDLNGDDGDKDNDINSEHVHGHHKGDENQFEQTHKFVSDSGLVLELVEPCSPIRADGERTAKR